MTVSIQSLVVADILDERDCQNQKWGEQNHDPITWVGILVEEVGEFAKAALHLRFGGPEAEELRREAIHCAAVSLAIVECLDRGLWQWPNEEGDR